MIKAFCYHTWYEIHSLIDKSYSNIFHYIFQFQRWRFGKVHWLTNLQQKVIYSNRYMYSERVRQKVTGHLGLPSWWKSRSQMRDISVSGEGHIKGLDYLRLGVQICLAPCLYIPKVFTMSVQRSIYKVLKDLSPKYNLFQKPLPVSYKETKCTVIWIC